MFKGVSKTFLVIIATLLVAISSFHATSYLRAQIQQQPVPLHDIVNRDEIPQIKHVYYSFSGQWLPDRDPAKIGAANCKTLINLRYGPGGDTLENINGISRINTTPVSITYNDIECGIHLNKSQPQESHVVVAAGDSGTTKIYPNDTVIPNTGDFSNALYTLDTDADFPRMAIAPQGYVIICDTMENLIWGGDEVPVAACLTCESEVTETCTNPKDYTREVQNRLTTGDEAMTVGGGNDDSTVFLCNFDGIDGSTSFTDTSVGVTSSPHTIVNGEGSSAEVDTDYKKFGTGSGYFDGGSSVYMADSVDWTMADASGNTDWTIDFWVKPEDYTGSMIFNHSEPGVLNDFECFFDPIASQGLKFRLSDGSTVSLNTGTWISTVSNPTGWHHVAITYDSNDDTFRLFVDGTLEDSDTETFNHPDISGLFIIGYDPEGDEDPFEGWIDEFRIRKGVCKWTSSFSPPVRAYTTGSGPHRWVIGVNQPISGASIYVSSQNGLSSQTIAVKEYNGSSWSDLTVTDGTNGLSQSGKITWASTVDTSVKRYFEGGILYWYVFELSAGDASISNIMVDSPMQDLADSWNGQYHIPIAFQASRSGTYEDYAIEVNIDSSSEDPIGATLGGLTSTDHVIVMFQSRAQATRWEILSGNTVTISSGVSVFYWSGVSWIGVASQYDGTDIGDQPLRSTGVISWQPPNREEEFPQTLFGETGYAYKFVWNGTLDSTGDEDGTLVDRVYGMPAPLKIPPFKFPLQYSNRILLCGYSQGNEGTRIDYCATNSPHVWNGTDSSDDTRQSLYIESSEELTGGGVLYNRYGSYLYELAVLFTANETHTLDMTGESYTDYNTKRVSDHVGCPAPMTITSVSMGYESAQELKRNILLWLSSTGPYLFDGTAPEPIKGISNYFKQSHDDYVGASAIANAFAWYDALYKEWNLRVGGEWLVYNLQLRRWYEKDIGSFSHPLQCAIPVEDTDGSRYTYSGVTAGYLYRLEYGTDWSNTPIDYEVELGDFHPDGDPTHITSLQKIKLVYKVISESSAVTVYHTRDSDSTTETQIGTIDLSSGSGRVNRGSILFDDDVNSQAWLHNIGLQARTSSTDGGDLQLHGFDYQYLYKREDSE